MIAIILHKLTNFRKGIKQERAEEGRKKNDIEGYFQLLIIDNSLGCNIVRMRNQWDQWRLLHSDYPLLRRSRWQGSHGKTSGHTMVPSSS
jgi:hypothetical protein